MPYGMIFLSDNTARETAEEIMNVFFCIDIFICFRTPYYDSEGEIHFSSKEIALNYLKGFFFIDFISSIPFS